MPRLCQTDGLTEDQTEILKAVRQFVDEQIIPVAQELEHQDEYPQEIVDGLKERFRGGVLWVEVGTINQANFNNEYSINGFPLPFTVLPKSS